MNKLDSVFQNETIEEAYKTNLNFINFAKKWTKVI